MYGFSNNDPEYMEYELERYRQEESDRTEREAEERRQREKERREDAYYIYRTAETWPEALRKQNHLMAEEASRWTEELAERYPDDFFGPGANACSRAIEIWEKIEASKQERITKLKQKLISIQDEIRLETAKQLFSESNTLGWRMVADAIENDEDLNNWLQW